MIKRIEYYESNPKVIDRLESIDKHIAAIDEKLRALVDLRVSQINGCVYCVDLHAGLAREAGETQRRLDCVAVWQECPFFDDRERAALAWAEAITYLSETHAPDHVYQALIQHFSKQEIVDLTYTIALTNTWNRIAVGFRHLPDISDAEHPRQAATA
jgi:AhpD family alkylhydroperoxidase